MGLQLRLVLGLVGLVVLLWFDLAVVLFAGCYYYNQSLLLRVVC